MKNGLRQPGNAATSSGAATPAMLSPTCVMAAPTARFFGSRYSAFSFPAAGTPTDSKPPSIARTPRSSPNPRLIPPRNDETDQNATAHAIPISSPSQSRSHPVNGDASAYATENAAISQPN